MNSFKSVKISTRISIALILPILGMVIFSGLSALEKRGDSLRMARLQSMADLAPVASALAHELQKERGMSAVFIGSTGKVFADELPKQRRLTDAARDAWLAAFAESAERNTALGAGAEAIATMLAELPRRRDAVAGLRLSVAEAAAYYTGTITRLIGLVEAMTQISTDARVARAIAAYSNFLQGKEQAGIERAMGGAGFGAGEFAPALYQRFVALVARQQTFLDMFAANATAAQRQALRDIEQGSDFKELARLRQVALDSPVRGGADTVTASEWFDAATKRIEHLKGVEDGVAADLGGVDPQLAPRGADRILELCRHRRRAAGRDRGDRAGGGAQPDPAIGGAGRGHDQARRRR